MTVEDEQSSPTGDCSSPSSFCIRFHGRALYLRTVCSQPTTPPRPSLLLGHSSAALLLRVLHPPLRQGREGGREGGAALYLQGGGRWSSELNETLSQALSPRIEAEGLGATIHRVYL